MDERNSNPNLRLHRDDEPESDLTLPPGMVADLRQEFGHADAEAPAWLTVAVAAEYERRRATLAGRSRSMKFAVIAACVSLAVVVGLRVQRAGTTPESKTGPIAATTGGDRALPHIAARVSGNADSSHRPGGPVSATLVMLKSRDVADVNHDGKVNILDAMKLAKLSLAQPTLSLAADLQNDKQTFDVSWDLNGDGKVDQADVDAVAALAVEGGAS